MRMKQLFQLSGWSALIALVIALAGLVILFSAERIAAQDQASREETARRAPAKRPDHGCVIRDGIRICRQK